MTATDDDAANAALGDALRQALALQDAPPAAIRAALKLWPAHGIGLAGAVRRLVATLSFDSAAPGAPVLATRSGASRTRHLLFSAEGRDVDLRVTEAGGAWQLTGQVLGPDESGTVEVATVQQPEVPVAQAPLDAQGAFSVERLQAGAYEIRFRLGGDAIALPPLELGGAAPSA